MVYLLLESLIPFPAHLNENLNGLFNTLFLYIAQHTSAHPLVETWLLAQCKYQIISCAKLCETKLIPWSLLVDFCWAFFNYYYLFGRFSLLVGCFGLFGFFFKKLKESLVSNCKTWVFLLMSMVEQCQEEWQYQHWRQISREVWLVWCFPCNCRPQWRNVVLFGEGQSEAQLRRANVQVCWHPPYSWLLMEVWICCITFPKYFSE